MSNHRQLNARGFETVFSLIAEARDEATRDFLDSNLFYIQGLCIQSDAGIRSNTAPPARPAAFLGPKAALNALLAFFASKFGRWRLNRLNDDSRAILVSGALNHLGALVRRLRASGRTIVYLEDRFNWEKFKFCLNEGIIFVLGPAYAGEKAVQPDFKSAALSEDQRRVLREAFQRGFLRLPYDARFLNSLFSAKRVESVLLDEDQTYRRALYVRARRAQKPCYVVSHGIPGTLLPAEDTFGLKGRYPSAVTFVQSELEKDAYLSIYYDAKMLRLTGLPRYDALYDMTRTEHGGKEEARVLFCGASLKSFDPSDFYPWMGLQNFYGAASEKQLGAVVRAVQKRSAATVLWIKPHYQEEGLWEAAMKRLDARINYRIFSHRADVFKLESEADLVVTPESTVIAEALMLGRPVVVLNFTGEPLMAPYADTGLIEEARSPEEVYPAMEKCLSPEYRRVFDEKRKNRLGYLAAHWDGKNTERVAEALLR